MTRSQIKRRVIRMRALARLRGVAGVLAAALVLTSAGSAMARPAEFTPRAWVTPSSAVQPTAPALQQLIAAHQRNDARASASSAAAAPRSTGADVESVYLAIGGGVVVLTLVGLGAALLSGQRRTRRATRRSSTIAA